jgi:hypothetical protein
MSRRRFASLISTALAVGLAVPVTVSAQEVRNPQVPAKPGEGAQWRLQLPESWNVEQVTFDPLGLGFDSFVQRLWQDRWQCPPGVTCWIGSLTVDDRVQPGERSLTFTITGGGQTRTLTGRVRVDPAADDDHDGMPDVWERREGLEPYDRLATSAPGDDPDGDGVANIDEFRAGTAPLGRYHLMFGSASPGERQQMQPIVTAIQPDSRPGRVRIRFLGDDGRQKIAPDYSEGPEIVAGAFGVSSDRVLAIEVESFQPIAAERQLWSGNNGLLSAARPAAPSTDWHFATGPTSVPVDTFLLAYNPGTAPVTATFTYYRTADEAPTVRERVLPPGRTTIWINADESRLSGRDFAVAISASAPILMDRGFRRLPPGRTAPQEQTGPGANALAGQWYFPRVQATRDSTEGLALANPTDQACGVELAVFGQTREPRVSYVTVPPRTRMALRARDLGIDGLSALRLSTVTGVPFVAELMQEGARADWFWSSPGATEIGRTWGMALDPGGHIAVLNPSDEDAEVEARAWYNPTYGTYSNAVRVRVPARRLVLVRTYDDPETPGDTSYQLSGRTVSVKSLPRADGRPGPAIVVGRGSFAGVEGVRRARVDSTIGTVLP